MVRWDRRTRLDKAYRKICSGNELYGNGGKGKSIPFLKGEVWANGRIKVREATNNEPWGASSTLMQEISNATNS